MYSKIINLSLLWIAVMFWRYAGGAPSVPLKDHPLNAEKFVLMEDSRPEVINKSIKSIFVVPEIGCAKGFAPDASGICRKIVKLEEETHWSFMLEKLNDWFGDYEYEDDFDKSQPYSIDIPIDDRNQYPDYYDDSPNSL